MAWQQTPIDPWSAQLATNTSNIATNTANIATNVTNIGTNTTNIATNASNIAGVAAEDAAAAVIADGSANAFTGIAGKWKTYVLGGKFVYAYLKLTYTGKGSATGTMGISMPTSASAADDTTIYPTALVSLTNGVTFAESLIAYYHDTNDTIRLADTDGAGGGPISDLTDADFSTAGAVELSLFYVSV